MSKGLQQLWWTISSSLKELTSQNKRFEHNQAVLSSVEWGKKIQCCGRRGRGRRGSRGWVSECSSPSSWPTGGLGRCWIAKSVHSCHFSLAWICAPAAGRRNNEYAAAGETRQRTGERRDGGWSVFLKKKGKKKGEIGTVWRWVVSCQREALSRHQETAVQRGRSFSWPH